MFVLVFICMKIDVKPICGILMHTMYFFYLPAEGARRLFAVCVLGAKELKGGRERGRGCSKIELKFEIKFEIIT